MCARNAKDVHAEFTVHAAVIQICWQESTLRARSALPRSTRRHASSDRSSGAAAAEASGGVAGRALPDAEREGAPRAESFGASASTLLPACQKRAEAALAGMAVAVAAVWKHKGLSVSLQLKRRTMVWRCSAGRFQSEIQTSPTLSMTQWCIGQAARPVRERFGRAMNAA